MSKGSGAIERRKPTQPVAGEAIGELVRHEGEQEAVKEMVALRADGR
jgi:hypothetical protein